ncbi:MAG: hypothetical protein M3268_08145, partial [Acidobacteriota bacterium]|nr:hypothetical protein [Acidobacteriota bacterium]
MKDEVKTKTRRLITLPSYFIVLRSAVMFLSSSVLSVSSVAKSVLMIFKTKRRGDLREPPRLRSRVAGAFYCRGWTVRKMT